MINHNAVTRRQFMKMLGGASFGGLVLAACVPSQSSAPAAADGEAASVASAAATITHWDFGGGGFAYIDDPIIPDFKELHADIQIEHVGIPEDGYDTKLKTAISSGTQPDVAACFNNTLWKAGLCLSLDELLANQGIDWQNDYYMPIIELNCIIDDGKLYGMPVLAHPWLGKFNKDLYAEAGLQPLDVNTTYDYAQWYEFAKAVNKPSENIQGRVWGTLITSPMWTAIKHAMADPKWAGEDGHTVIGNIDSPGWIAMYQHMADVWTEELAPIGDVAESLGGDPFRAGQVGFSAAELHDFKDDMEAGLNAGLCQFPCIGPEKGVTGLGAGTSPWTIFKASPSPEAAWQWVHYLGTDGAITFSRINGAPPMMKKLIEEMKWVDENPFGADVGRDVVTLLDNLPHIPFTPDFHPIVEPMLVAWTRITEENVPVETAIAEAAVEVQDLLDEAWEQWESLAA